MSHSRTANPLHRASLLFAWSFGLLLSCAFLYHVAAGINPVFRLGAEQERLLSAFSEYAALALLLGVLVCRPGLASRCPCDKA
jgi:hypothetical protein